MIINWEQFVRLYGAHPELPPISSFIGARDLGILLALIKAFHCCRILEIGVGTGANAKAILDRCSWIEAYVGVDVPPGTIPTLPFQQTEVPQHAGHLASADNRFSTMILERGSLSIEVGQLPGFDFVFIDGDHSLEAVKHDTLLAKRSIQTGVLCWHDYDLIQPWIDELNRTGGDSICLVEPTTMCFELVAA